MRAPLRRGTRLILWAGATAVVAALTAAAWDLTESRSAFKVVSIRVVTAGPELELDPAISPDGRYVAYAAGPMFAMRIYVRPIGGGPSALLTGALPGDHRWPRWSADGANILFLSIAKPPGPYGGPLYSVPRAGGTPQRASPASGGDLITPGWSRDGKRLAYSDGRRILLRSLERNSTITIAEGTELHSPAISPDGRTIAYVAGNILGPSILNIASSAVWIVAQPSGIPIRLTDRLHASTSPVFTPDGRNLLYVSDVDGESDVYQQRLTSRRRPDGAPVRLTTGLAAASLTLSADGRHAIVGVRRLRSRVWAAPISPRSVTPESALIPVTRDPEAIEALDVSRDGMWLAFDSNRSGKQDIYKIHLTGGEPVQLTRDSAPDFAPVWSPDIREIAYYSLRHGNRDLRVMRQDGTRDQAVTIEPSEDVYPAWSPDGQRLAFGSFDGQVGRVAQIFVISRDAQGQWGHRRQLTSDGGAVPHWSPDGRWIAYIRSGSLRLIDPSGRSTRTLATARGFGARLQSPAWGKDPRVVYVRTEILPGPTKFWAVPVDGGRPRLVLELRAPTHLSRRQEWATDGRRLFFTLASDESNVVALELR